MTDSMDHGHSGKAEELIHCKDSCLKLCYVQWDVTGQLVNQSVGQCVMTSCVQWDITGQLVNQSVGQSVSVWWHQLQTARTQQQI